MVCSPDHVMAPTLGPNSQPALHNLVHNNIGGLLSAPGELPPRFGTMVLPSSPNEPVFFLHHSNVDRIWNEWQEIHGIHTYEPASGFPGNSADDPMMPYEEIGIPVTPDAVADIQALGYSYQ
jgi:tyrosinase